MAMNSEAYVADLVQQCFHTGQFDHAKFKSLAFAANSTAQQPQQRLALTRKNLDKGLLRSGMIVEYRGMVQDMFDPELFCLKYTSPHDPKQEFCGLFQDFVPTGDWDPTSGRETLGEREVVYLVPVPGETEWARKVGMPESELGEDPTVVALGRERISTVTKKRERGESSDGQRAGPADEGDIEMDAGGEDQAAAGKRKKELVDVKAKGKQTRLHIHENHPIPTERDVPCMAKFYDPVIQYAARRRYQLHDVVRVIGVLSLNFDESARPDGAEELDFGLETRDCLPASVAPRLHVVDFEIEESITPISAPVATFEQVRNGCLSWLTHALGGDSVAAEFLLLWCVSGITASASSADDVVVGKISLGMVRMTDPSVVSNIKRVLSDLLHRLQVVEPDHLQQHKFIPRKNMDMNRLDAGRLQVAHGTRLLVDETLLTPRTLDESALKNLQALNRLAESQKIEYDFKFYQRDQNVDQPVLVLSSSNSKPVLIAAVDCIVPLMMASADASSAAMVEPSPQGLDMFRSFIETARVKAKALDLSDDAIKVVESDFVSSRQTDNSVSDKDLHLWLNLARFTAATMGHDAITVHDYSRARTLDVERRRRLL